MLLFITLYSTSYYCDVFVPQFLPDSFLKVKLESARVCVNLDITTLLNYTHFITVPMTRVSSR